MLLNLIKELPWMFVIALVIWLFIAFLFWVRFFGGNSIRILQKTINLVIIVIIALVLTIGDIWLFVQYLPSHYRRDISQEQGVSLTANELIHQFQSNENLANTLYNNKVVEITGEVEKSETDSSNTTLVLKAGIEGASISCRLQHKQDVVSGATVTVKGLLTGYIMEQVQLSEAIITGTIKPPVKNLDTSHATTTVRDTLTTVTAAKPEIKAEAKVYSTQKAKVRFFSKTPEEDIEATNSQVISKLNEKTGQLSFAALIKGFHFENELMQDHFNSKEYMNSDSLPKSEFKGSVTNISSVDFSKDGVYPLTVTGNLSIHGFTHKIAITGSLTITNGKVALKSIFNIKRLDYGITTNEIADVLEITVTCAFD